MMAHQVALLPDTFAICRLAPDAAIPSWATAGTFSSITRTAEELSVVCPQSVVPDGVRCERDWRCLRLAGTFDLSVVGILAALTAPFAEAGISVFALCTFDTDYLFVKAADLTRSIDVLRQQGHSVD